jgi:signal peptide peptidase SppA
MNKIRILSAVADQYWALEPGYLARMSAVLQNWAIGKDAAPEVMADIQSAQAARAVRSKTNSSIGGGIAVLPLYGVVSQRASLLDEICDGGTSTQKFTQSFRDAMADDAVGGILIDIDSPGGSVFGVADLYDEIMSARGVKPVYGLVNSLCASAAYWLASACSQIIAVKGSMTGSIGVYTQHVDMSEALKAAGISQEFISAGKYKVEGNQYGPLTDEGRAFTQSQIDSYYAAFTQAVSKGRGVPIAQARDGMGEGRCLLPADALAANMIDAVDTFDGAIKRLKSAIKSGGANAATDAPIVDAVSTTAELAAVTEAQSAARNRALQLATV